MCGQAEHCRNLYSPGTRFPIFNILHGYLSPEIPFIQESGRWPFPVHSRLRLLSSSQAGGSRQYLGQQLSRLPAWPTGDLENLNPSPVFLSSPLPLSQSLPLLFTGLPQLLSIPCVYLDGRSDIRSTLPLSPASLACGPVKLGLLSLALNTGT